MRQQERLLKFIKEQYPPGTRIRLTEMQDPYAPVPPGTEGTIDHVDDAGQLHMKWDNGRTLALLHEGGLLAAFKECFRHQDTGFRYALRRKRTWYDSIFSSYGEGSITGIVWTCRFSVSPVY